jgi:hypothetical protein
MSIFYNTQFYLLVRSCALEKTKVRQIEEDDLIFSQEPSEALLREVDTFKTFEEDGFGSKLKPVLTLN